MRKKVCGFFDSAKRHHQALQHRCALLCIEHVWHCCGSFPIDIYRVLFRLSNRCASFVCPCSPSADRRRVSHSPTALLLLLVSLPPSLPESSFPPIPSLLAALHSGAMADLSARLLGGLTVNGHTLMQRAAASVTAGRMRGCACCAACQASTQRIATSPVSSTTAPPSPHHCGRRDRPHRFAVPPPPALPSLQFSACLASRMWPSSARTRRRCPSQSTRTR